jgi:hypothetical protein
MLSLIIELIDEDPVKCSTLSFPFRTKTGAMGVLLYSQRPQILLWHCSNLVFTSRPTADIA